VNRCQSVDEGGDQFSSVLTFPRHSRSHAQIHGILDGLHLLTAQPLNAAEELLDSIIWHSRFPQGHRDSMPESVVSLERQCAPIRIGSGLFPCPAGNRSPLPLLRGDTLSGRGERQGASFERRIRCSRICQSITPMCASRGLDRAHPHLRENHRRFGDAKSRSCY
jgi:hypothetical protein